MKRIFLSVLLTDSLLRRTALLLCAGLFCAFTAQAQITVTGKVTDAAGRPVPGVAVVVKGANVGTTANIDGNYSLSVLGTDVVLQYSFLGYITAEEVVGSRTVINVALTEDSKQLEEVVVVGYGTMKKKDLTGAVGSINAEKLQKELPATIQDLMRSNVPGLSMAYSGDAKGNALGIMIRGKSNFRKSSTTEGQEYQATAPLLVLDGAIYYGELTDINPGDVERIDVLKDASSAAVYGSQSANGVILITTKKGRQGRPQIRFGSTMGVAFTSGVPESYGPDEYVGYRRDVMISRYGKGQPDGFYNDPSGLSGDELAQWLGNATDEPEKVWLTRLGFSDIEIENIINKKYVNWKDLVYHNAFRQDYNLSVSGSQNNTTYYTSLGFTKNQNNVRGGGFEAIRARINLESKINNYITYGINAQFTKRDEGFVGYSSSITSSSPYGDIYDEDGNMRVYPMGNLNSYNPLIDRNYTNRLHDIENINASLFLKVDLGWGFSIKTTYTPRYEWTTYLNHKSEDHPLWYAPAERDNVTRRHTKRLHWNWDNILAWDKSFGKHSVNFTFLANWEKEQRWRSVSKNSQFDPNDNLGYHGIGWGTTDEVSSTDTQATGEALMARANYGYADKYNATFTYRRDGYSEFGLNHPYANFFSFGLGWTFTNEEFIPKNEWLNYGKLRLSYGQNGNRDFHYGYNQALLAFVSREYNYYDYTNGNVINLNTYFASRMGNADLKWESTVSYNVGLDFGLLKNRITGSLDMYHKSTSDLLKERQLPWMIGYATVMSNIGKLENRGLELLITSNNIRHQDFAWTTTFTYAINQNKIINIDGIYQDVLDANGNVIGSKKADASAENLFIGRPIDAIWGFKYMGVWQKEEAAVAEMYGQQPGDPKIYDKNGDFSYSDEDKVFMGESSPRHRLSMRNDFTYKNWNFSINMYANLKYLARFDRGKNDGALNMTVNQLKTKYWTEENPSRDYPRLGATAPPGGSYSMWKDASFLRIENISIGYSLPSKWLEPAKIASANINISLKNAYTFTKWPGEDPENMSGTGVGNQTPRILYFGVNVTF